MVQIREAQWQVNSICNLRCKHCFLGERDGTDVAALKFNEAKEVIDILVKNGLKKLNFTLVEPLLNADLFKIINYCTQMSLQCNILTNGMLLDKHMNQILNTNLSNLGVSLAGISPEDNDEIRGSGSFEKVISSIKLLIQSRRNSNYIPIVVYFTISSLNKDKIDSIIPFFNNLGIDKLVVNEIDTSVGKAKHNKYLKNVTDDFLEVLAKNYSKLKQRNFSLEVANVSPYEALYYNFIFGISLPVFIPNCGILADAYFIDSESNISLCMFSSMKGEKIFKKYNVKEELSHFFEERNSFLEKTQKIKVQYQTNDCSNCIYFQKCNPCMISLKNGEFSKFKSNCDDFIKKIEQLVILILMDSKNYKLHIKKEMYVEEGVYCTKVINARIGALPKIIKIEDTNTQEKIKLILSDKEMNLECFLDGICDKYKYLLHIVNSNIFYITGGKKNEIRENII